MDDNKRRAAWEERYRAGPRPWDTGITPPEVVAFWQNQPSSPVSLAIDIGCGTGTNAVYLAGLGLSAVGVDLSLTALLLAQQRRDTLPLPVQQRLHFAQADVSRLPFQNTNAVYILDIGCFHAIPADARCDYANGIVKNLTPGGLNTENAISLIVNGFCKEVFKELPMEFAVEAQKLLGVSLEGSVG